MNLEEFVCQFCRKHNITKQQLAKSASMSRSTLYRMLEKDSTPTLNNLTKLAISMQVHPQYLVKLEWRKQQKKTCKAKPILPLVEPMLWFYKQSDSTHFIDETVPDDSIVLTNEMFDKTWRLQNTGETVWENRYLQCQNLDRSLDEKPCLKEFIGENSFSLIPIEKKIPIPLTNPGEIVDLTVRFKAPNIAATVFSYWKIIDEHGNLCFPDSLGVYARVRVVSAKCASKNDGQNLSD